MSVKSINILKLLITGAIVLLWPFSFFLNNKLSDFFYYFLPSLFLLLAFYFYQKKQNLWIFCLLAVGIINPLLSLFPAVFGIVYFVLKKSKYNLFFLILALVIFSVNFKNYTDKSIFYYSENDRQEIFRRGNVYPTIWMSRLFQNKPGIYWDRFKFNFFAITDPNNYFFHFHPREITVTNQNLDKFPFLSMVFFLTGFYLAVKNKNVLIFFVFLALIFDLSFLKNFDQNDASLFVPFVIILIYGLEEFVSKQTLWKKIFMVIFLIFTITEFLHVLIRSI